MGTDDQNHTGQGPRELSRTLADDNSYNFIMALMQRQFSSAISAGMAGYAYSQAWSAPQGQNLTMGQVSAGQMERPQLAVNYSRETSKGSLTLTEGDKTLLQAGVVVGGKDHPTPTGNFHAGSWEKRPYEQALRLAVEYTLE